MVDSQAQEVCTQKLQTLNQPNPVINRNPFKQRIPPISI